MLTLVFSSAVAVQFNTSLSPFRACTGPLVFRYTSVMLLTATRKERRGNHITRDGFCTETLIYVLPQRHADLVCAQSTCVTCVWPRQRRSGSKRGRCSRRLGIGWWSLACCSRWCSSGQGAGSGRGTAVEAKRRWYAFKCFHCSTTLSTDAMTHSPRWPKLRHSLKY